MATQSWSTTFANTDDATFRAWGGELSAKLQAAGLTVASDTGQINWGSVTRPTASNVGGYEMYRFNDALQATAPIFIKFEYGSGISVAAPQLWVSVGTATNGSGTLTGVTVIRRVFTYNVSGGVPPTTTNYLSQICVLDGYFALLYKRGAGGRQPSAWGTFIINRTVDQVTGANNGEGYTAFISYPLATALGVRAECYNFATATLVFSNSEDWGAIWGNVTNTLVGGTQPQVYKAYTAIPKITINPYILLYVNAEMINLSTFQATILGAVSRTYMNGGTDLNYQSNLRASGAAAAFVFE